MAWEIRKRRLNVDVETFSSVDLLKCGHHAYVRSPDFQIMLLAYGWDDEPVQLVDLTAGEQIPDDVAMAICHGTDGNGSTVECRAFNAAFELACFGQHFKCAIPTGHWRCTSVHALYCGLPNSLAKVSAALGLPADIGKANTGRALIRYFCVPCKPTKANGLRTRNLPIHNLEKWELFKSYCVQDVTAERAVKVRVEKIPFPEIEQRAWEMDQAINERGILIDQELARAAVEKGKVHRDRLLVEAARITGLSNPNSVKQLKEWLLEVEDLEDDEDWGRLISAKLDKKTILKLLAGLKNVLFGEQTDTFSETDLGEFDLDDAKSVLRDLEARAETAWALAEEEASALFRRLRLVKAVRVLQLRQEIGKASVKKYDAMLRAMCPDGRVRGVHQFYGANRTGRWAGKIVQTQNMRSNSLPDMAAARDAVVRMSIEDAEFWFGNYSELLSQCVRTAIVAAPGKTFVVCDYSSIESLKLAWLANEEWRLDVFRTHGKIYEMSAALSFKVPFAEIMRPAGFTDVTSPEWWKVPVKGKHHPLRKKGKVTELACLGYATLVLTDVGTVPIQDVTTAMRVWDGVEWVRHSGVIYKGKKDVLEYQGLVATADHLVWVEGSREPIAFAVAAERGARLVRAGDGGAPIRTRVGRERAESMEAEVEAAPGHNAMPGLRAAEMGLLGGACLGGLQRLRGVRDVFESAHPSEVFGSSAYGSEAALYQPERQGVSQLRRPWDRVQVRVDQCSRTLDTGEPRTEAGWPRVGPEGERQALRAGQPALGNALGEQLEHEAIRAERAVGRSQMAVRVHTDTPPFVGRNDTGGDSGGRPESCGEQAQELARHRGKAEVFDILNAGPRHRFTAAGVLVHNCGYGGSVNGMINMGALDQGLHEEELQPMVDAWRTASPSIVQMWWDVDRAFKRCIYTHNPTPLPQYKISIFWEHGSVFIRLPSGRCLCYLGAAVENGDIVFWGVDQRTKQWMRQRTWGSRTVENICQASARDNLRDLMLSIENDLMDPWGDIVMHVHDEVVMEVDIAFAERLMRATLDKMKAPIRWAPGMPLKGAGYITPFYCKDE